MHLVALLYVLSLLINSTSAAAAGSPTATGVKAFTQNLPAATPTSSLAHPTPTPSASSAKSSSSKHTTHQPLPATTHRTTTTPGIIPHTTPRPTTSHTFTFPPGVHPSGINRPPPQQVSTAQKPVSIVLEALGGTVAALIIISICRCVISYYRTPRRDRVAAFISRHELQREMDEIEEQQRSRLFNRSSMIGPAPPPYIPPPPVYRDNVDDLEDNPTSSPPTSPLPSSSRNAAAPAPITPPASRSPSPHPRDSLVGSRSQTPVQLPNR